MIGRRRFVGNLFAVMAAVPAVSVRRARAKPPSTLTDVPVVFDKALKATIPEGTSLRIVARSGVPAVADSAYVWHDAPDGGACFEAPGGGWVYVSNSEMSRGRGGAGALRFDPSGALTNSYSILQGTSDNCAGGKTPWGTWLSCEENDDDGQVYECDPFGEKAARVLPGLGSFNHEAAAVDPATGHVYLTEDERDGCLYRFVPARAGDLTHGHLEVALAEASRLTWTRVPDPLAVRVSLRKQVRDAARFRGGEGIVYSDGHIYFTTKHDNRVWSLAMDTQELGIVYDAEAEDNPVLFGVDNIEVSPNGELLVAEDNGDMQIVALGPDYAPVPLVTLHDQEDSEIAGPAFSPDGTRLYFSSQRGFGGSSSDGLTYELDLSNAAVFR